MAQQEHNEEQIIPEQFNMVILEFLIKNPLDFWNANEISQKATSHTLNYTRVNKSLTYFNNKKFVVLFSDLSPDQQKKLNRASTKEFTSKSCQITEHGKEIYKNIMDSCLDPVGQRLLFHKN